MNFITDLSNKRLIPEKAEPARKSIASIGRRILALNVLIKR